MDRFLRRHGFTPIQFRTQSMYRNVGEVLGRIGSLRNGLSKVLSQCLQKVLPRPILEGGFWLDLADIMFVAARKND